jgi:hypothetical protein
MTAEEAQALAAQLGIVLLPEEVEDVAEELSGMLTMADRIRQRLDPEDEPAVPPFS